MILAALLTQERAGIHTIRSVLDSLSRGLTDSELADIGISREQADAEANRPMRFRF